LRLSEYLYYLSENDLDNLISKYNNVIEYNTPKDIQIGLLRFSKPPKNTAFLFNLKTDCEQVFHTVGMKFNIDIYFFDKNRNLVKKVENVPPGARNINSTKSCLYVVEIPRIKK